MSWKWTSQERLEYRRNLPRKRQVASLVAYHAQLLLLVKPTYRAGWLLPGGVVELDESPAQCCRREAEEELGLPLPIRGLCLVDYTADPGDKSGESIHFWFDAEPMSSDQVARIVLPGDELAAFHLATLEEARELLVPNMAARLGAYMSGVGSGVTVYSENGHRVCPA